MTSHSCCIRRCSLVAFALIGTLAGCAGRPAIYSSDKNLRRTSAQFAADAAKRHPYPADAPRGGTLPSRAQVGYMVDVLELVNLSDSDWDGFDIWVNKKYVVHVPFLAKNKLERVTFQMLFDDSGNSFPTDNSKVRVESVEVFKDGKMYDVNKQLAD